jgi:hypothetical protein
MPTLGYAPDRLRHLGSRTRRAIEDLAAIRSDDDEAADALRAVRLTRRNLEDVWMPLIERIESSEAMRTWVATGWARDAIGVLGERWAPPPAWLALELPDPDLAALTDGELLDLLRRLDDEVPADERGVPLLDEAFGDRRGELAAELSRRIRTDPAFGRSVVAALGSSPSIALLLVGVDVPVEVTTAGVVALLDDVWWEAGYEMDKLGAAVDALVADLLDHPVAALRVLEHDHVRRRLASWPAIDQDLAADLVHAGLAEASGTSPAHYRRGVGVLRELIVLANEDPIDDVGFGPGLSTGLAAAIGTYLPSFIDTIDIETGFVNGRGAGPHGIIDVTYGTHEELIDFFGAIMRDAPTAQGLLGAALSDVTRQALGPEGSAPRAIRPDTVAELAEMLRDAAANEDAEDTVAAAARMATLRDATGVLTFAASTVLAVRGAGAVAQLIAERGIGDAVDAVAADRRDGRVSGPDYEEATRDMIVTETARRLATDAGLRARAGVVDASERAWVGVLDLLDELDRVAGDAGFDPDVTSRLLDRVEDEVRRLGGGDHLDALLGRPAVHHLTTRPAGQD